MLVGTQELTTVGNNSQLNGCQFLIKLVPIKLVQQFLIKLNFHQLITAVVQAFPPPSRRLRLQSVHPVSTRSLYTIQ